MNHLRRILLWGLLLLLAPAWSACAGGVEFEAGPLGAVTVAPGDAIQIRSMSPRHPGLAGHDAVALALEDYGPIKGHAVAMGTGLDSQCSEEGGRAAAERVAGDPQVLGVIGPACSIAVVGALPILSAAGMVMVSHSNTAPSLTSDLRGNAGADHRSGYYRTATNDIHRGLAVARFAYTELGLRNIGVIHDGDPYTSGLAHSFRDAFRELGGSVTDIGIVSKGQTDLGSVLAQVAADGPDGLFLPLFQSEGSHVLTQKDQVAGLEEVTVFAVDTMLVPEILALPESVGIYFSGPATHMDRGVNEATGHTGPGVLAAYREVRGETAHSTTLAHTYDATTLLLRAIEEVAVADGAALFIDRARLRETLTNTANFNGLIGTISCDEFGDCGPGHVHIYQHTTLGVTQVEDLPLVYEYSP